MPPALDPAAVAAAAAQMAAQATDGDGQQAAAAAVALQVAAAVAAAQQPNTAVLQDSTQQQIQLGAQAAANQQLLQNLNHQAQAVQAQMAQQIFLQNQAAQHAFAQQSIQQRMAAAQQAAFFQSMHWSTPSRMGPDRISIGLMDDPGGRASWTNSLFIDITIRVVLKFANELLKASDAVS